MIVIPAIDMRGGKVVRLIQGDFSKQITYGDDPVAVARQWAEAGAQRLHLVDLDGAKSGIPQHLELISRIAREIVNVPIEVGGGIRTIEIIQKYLEAGVKHLVLGTKACTDSGFVKKVLREYGSDVIYAAVDVTKSHADVLYGNMPTQVTTAGWLQTEPETPKILINRLIELGIKTVIYTDITKDGTMEGPALNSYKQLLENFGNQIELIASGGVSSLNDLIRLKDLETESKHKLFGAITGRALYDGKINLKEAIQKCSPSGSSPASI